MGGVVVIPVLPWPRKVCCKKEFGDLQKWVMQTRLHPRWSTRREGMKTAMIQTGPQTLMIPMKSSRLDPAQAF